MPFPDAAALTRRIVGALGDEPITLYPVRAASVAAYLARGSLGNTIAAIVERRPVVNDGVGAGGVDNSEIVLSTDSDTADTYSLALRRASFAWKGRLYDIVRVEEDDPGAVNCFTTEYV